MNETINNGVELAENFLRETHEAMIRHNKVTGKNVTRFYFGASQMHELVRLAKFNAPVRFVAGCQSHRFELMGIPVFEVNSDDHFFVG